MATTLNVEFKGDNYTLEFTRKSIETMEKQGFDISKISTAPMTTIPTLFAGAFLARHKFVKREKIDEIYFAMPRKEELLGKLAEMYNEPISTLIEEQGDEGNGNWG